MKTRSKLSVLVWAFALILISCNEQKNEASTEAETNKKALEEKMIATNNEVFKAWNTDDYAIIKANLTPDFTRKENGEPAQKNRDEYIDLIKTFKTAVPDMNFTHDESVVSGNMTLTKWTAKGTNTGMFGDQPATGKLSITHGFTILYFNDEGKVMAEEAYFNPLSYLEAWGYEVSPPSTD